MRALQSFHQENPRNFGAWFRLIITDRPLPWSWDAEEAALLLRWYHHFGWHQHLMDANPTPSGAGAALGTLLAQAYQSCFNGDGDTAVWMRLGQVMGIPDTSFGGHVTRLSQRLGLYQDSTSESDLIHVIPFLKLVGCPQQSLPVLGQQLRSSLPIGKRYRALVTAQWGPQAESLLKGWMKDGQSMPSFLSPAEGDLIQRDPETKRADLGFQWTVFELASGAYQLSLVPTKSLAPGDWVGSSRQSVSSEIAKIYGIPQELGRDGLVQGPGQTLDVDWPSRPSFWSVTKPTPRGVKQVFEKTKGIKPTLVCLPPQWSLDGEAEPGWRWQSIKGQTTLFDPSGTPWQAKEESATWDALDGISLLDHPHIAVLHKFPEDLPGLEVMGGRLGSTLQEGVAWKRDQFALPPLGHLRLSWLTRHGHRRQKEVYFLPTLQLTKSTAERPVVWIRGMEGLVDRENENRWYELAIEPKASQWLATIAFKGWPMLGWIGQDPSDDRCPKCHGPMLLPVTCGYEGCAQEGLLGKAIYTGFPPRLSELVHPLGPSAAGVEGSVLLVPKDEWPEDRPSLPVILKAGAVCEVSESDAPWRIVAIGSDEEGKQTCPRCDQPETLENTWSNKFHAGAMDLIALDRLLSLQLPDSRALDEPGKGRRVLTFADSRQGAARLAPRLAFTHRVLLVRRWIIDTLGSLPDSIPQYEKFQSQLEGLRRVNEGGLMDDIIRQKEAELATLQSGETILGLVQEMAKDQARLTSWAKSLEGTRFQQRFNGIALLSGVKYGKEPDLETLWYGLIRNEVGKGALNTLSIGKSGKDPLTQSLMDFMAQELLLSVLRELCRPAGRTPTATKLGLVQIQWPSLVGTLESLTDQGIPEPLHQEVFERACNLMLEQRCVMLPRPFTGQEEDWGQAFMNRRAVLQESSNPGVFSFASDRIGMRKFTAFLDLLCQHCKGRTDETWNKRVYVALWEGLRQVAQGMRILNFTSVDGVDSLRLNAELIQIRSGKGAFLCERCGSISPWGLLKACSEPRYRDARGKERSEPCAGMLLPIDPSLDQGADSDAYPHAHNVLLRREPPEGLTAFEHTAQRSGDQVRRDELLFRQAKMNVLCSSTTLEMGIDLPDLDSVVLMGVPPAASNHTQRVGRAGRSRARSCLALTFAGEDSFDRWAHRDLKAFLKRPGITPRVDLEREEKLRQHFFAWRLGLLVRGGDLVKVGSGSEVLNKISVFAGIDPEIRRKSIDDWNSRYPDTPWTLDVSAPGWGDEAVKRWETLTVEQWTRGQALFGKGQKILAGWLKEGRKDLEEQLHRIRKQVLRVEESISNGPEQQTKFMRLLVHSLRQYDALQWLAENHLLPRFGLGKW